MLYFVYILMSEKDGRLYVGCTSNIEQRIKRHNAGAVSATCKRRPLVLIHSEDFSDKAAAFNRERFLKSLWGSREKKNIFQNYINKIEHVS